MCSTYLLMLLDVANRSSNIVTSLQEFVAHFYSHEAVGTNDHNRRAGSNSRVVNMHLEDGSATLPHPSSRTCTETSRDIWPIPIALYTVALVFSNSLWDAVAAYGARVVPCHTADKAHVATVTTRPLLTNVATRIITNSQRTPSERTTITTKGVRAIRTCHGSWLSTTPMAYSLVRR